MSDPIFIGRSEDLTPVYANRLEAPIPAGAAAGTEYRLATLPTSLILHASPVFWGAMGSGVTLDFELHARNRLAPGATSLVSGIDVSSAVSVAVNLTDDADNIGRPLWHILGENSDIRTDVDLVATVRDATTGTAGAVVVNLFYAY